MTRYPVGCRFGLPNIDPHYPDLQIFYPDPETWLLEIYTVLQFCIYVTGKYQAPDYSGIIPFKEHFSSLLLTFDFRNLFYRRLQ